MPVTAVGQSAPRFSAADPVFGQNDEKRDLTGSLFLSIDDLRPIEV